MQTQDAPDEDDPQETRLREALDILISKEGQRKIAEILGVDRKNNRSVPAKDRLTPRMRLAIERELMGSDNPEHEHQKPPQDDIASTVGLLKEAGGRPDGSGRGPDRPDVCYRGTAERNGSCPGYGTGSGDQCASTPEVAVAQATQNPEESPTLTQADTPERQRNASSPKVRGTPVGSMSRQS